jgi:hypothetical protein
LWTLGARENPTPLKWYLSLDCARGIFYENDQREIVRCVDDEIDQFRDFEGCQSAEQQADNHRKGKPHTH